MILAVHFIKQNEEKAQLSIFWRNLTLKKDSDNSRHNLPLVCQLLGEFAEIQTPITLK